MHPPVDPPRRSLPASVNAAAHGWTRRAFLGHAGGAALAGGATAVVNAAARDNNAEGPRRARRPAPPYRAWFAPRLFDRDVDLYANMTLDASGWLDPRLAELAGKTALGWAWGLNHPDAGGAEYWSHACSVEGRSYPRNSRHQPEQPSRQPEFVSAGIALDEWVPAKRPENERWLAEGLRAGRKAGPDVFIAAWTTDPTPLLFELGRDGTADLILVEGYTHSAASVGPGLVTSWDNAIRRCAALAEAGLEAKTVFCFGHVTAKADARGEHLKGAWLRERCGELRRRFPRMPGVAFYQHEAEDSPEFRELVGVCDRLSGEFWPDGAGR